MSGYLNSESLEVYDSQETRTVGMKWGNAALSVHYRDRLGSRGLVDLSLGHSRFDSDLIALGRDGPTLVTGDPGDYVLPTDTILFGDGSMSESRADLRVTWHVGRTTIIAGTQAVRFVGDHDYDLADEFDVDEGFFFSPLALRESRWRLAAYSSVEVPLQRGFSTRTGLRVDRFQGLATAVAPFAELSYGASWWEARASASRSHQALASVRDEEALGASFIAYDLLVPVSEAPVPRNTEFSIGWEGSRGGLRVRLDTYTRKLDGLRLPALGTRPGIGAALGDPSLWEVSSGSATGIEASSSWMWDRGLSLLGSYRWARVSRTVGSRTYTPRFHRDHEFELGVSYARGPSSWSARISLRSGQPVTPVLAIVPVEEYGARFGGIVPLGGEYNSESLPHYARIDIGWRRETRVSWFGGGSLVPYVSVANLFSLPNVVGWFVERDFSGDGVRKVYVPQLPMLPFLGLEFRF